MPCAHTEQYWCAGQVATANFTCAGYTCVAECNSVVVVRRRLPWADPSRSVVRSGHVTSAQGESQKLSVDTVVPYLIEHGLLSADAIVASDLEVIDAGRRNQNLKIVRRDGPSYLLKQAGAGEHATEATIRAEAAFYKQCQVDATLADVMRTFPSCTTGTKFDACFFPS